MAKVMGAGMWVAALLSGCAAQGPPTPAGPPPSASPSPSAPADSPAASLDRYRCEGSLEFTVRFADDSATLDARPGGSEVLLRDAGGVTPQQTVYSNLRMRAEFGLGANGREAILRYADPPRVARCVME